MTKTIVITGATSGIGYAITLAFARTGANVAISGRRADRGPDAIAEIERLGGTGWSQTTDVQDAGQIEAFIAGAMQRFGPIDTLVTVPGSSCRCAAARRTRHRGCRRGAVN